MRHVRKIYPLSPQDTFLQVGDVVGEIIEKENLSQTLPQGLREVTPVEYAKYTLKQEPVGSREALPLLEAVWSTGILFVNEEEEVKRKLANKINILCVIVVPHSTAEEIKNKIQTEVINDEYDR